MGGTKYTRPQACVYERRNQLANISVHLFWFGTDDSTIGCDAAVDRWECFKSFLSWSPPLFAVGFTILTGIWSS